VDVATPSNSNGARAVKRTPPPGWGSPIGGNDGDGGGDINSHSSNGGNDSVTRDVDGDGDGVRINKCFKDITSRREADRMVRDGRVTVNGVVAAMGKRVSPGDHVVGFRPAPSAMEPYTV
jgi:hypothetical protein